MKQTHWHSHNMAGSKHGARVSMCHKLDVKTAKSILDVDCPMCLQMPGESYHHYYRAERERNATN